MPQTLFDKIWNAHLVRQQDDGTCLIYIDRHLVHEVTSPQAFEGLRQTGRTVRQPLATLAVPDHNVPTTGRANGISDPESRLQVETLADNARSFGVPYFAMDDIRQGIVHVIGPEQGFTLPGMTIVCGDSHTSTHGAFGALAFGIGTSEVEHVLATQTLLQKPARIRLHFLPPYSPNLNPIERLWRFMYQKVLANQCFEKFSGFKAAIFGFFDRIGSYHSELQTRLTDNFQRIQPLP